MGATTADSLTDVPPFGPATSPERIAALDILRGVAVFGIILSDIDSVYRPLTTSDRVATFLYSFFVWDRFWPLFSFLFGLGFAMQVLRAESRGVPFVLIYLRRLVVLYLFGVANIIFLSQIWRGDFLHRYAVLGFGLVLFRRWSQRPLLLAALLFFLLPTGREVIAMREPSAPPTSVQLAPSPASPAPVQPAGVGAQRRRLRTEGTYWEVAAFSAQRFLVGLTGWETYVQWLGRTFPLFLLGMYAARRAMTETFDRNRRFVRKVLWWGLMLGVLGGLWSFLSLGAVVLPAGPARLIGGVFERLAGPALSLFYAAAIFLLSERIGWKAWLGSFSVVGRTALSNYLFQAAVLAVIGSGYGLGLYGTLSPLAGAGLACLIFAIELALSNWWMRHFRFGPAEWVWRSATYRTWQPLRAERSNGLS